MTKTAFVKAMSDKYNVPVSVCGEWVTAVFETLGEAATINESIQFKNFGVFKHKKRAPRVGRNPKTGETVQIPEKTTLVFVPCEKIVDAVAGGAEQ